MRWLLRSPLPGIAFGLAVGCSSDEQRARVRAADSVAATAADSVARARQDSFNRSQPGYIIDSILPIEEAMRRFNADLTSRPRTLENGATSRDGLVRMWVRALESRDSVTVIRTAVSRPEFALLVYPSSRFTGPPLQQMPSIVWLQMSNTTIAGFRRTFERLGGTPIGFVDYRCAPRPQIEGENRIWGDCRVRRQTTSGDTVAQALFGPIIERQGRFKFLTLASDL
ncbi:MAG: hypothetical protein ACT4OZ_15910 [Gemmatimonadota bacterium]